MVNNEPLLENAVGPSLTGSDVLFEDQTLTKEVETSRSPLNPDTPQFFASKTGTVLTSDNWQMLMIIDHQHSLLVIEFPHNGLIGWARTLWELVKSLAEQVSLSQLPPPEPSVFYGDLMRYPSWKTAFQTLIEHQRIPAGERLHYLKKYIGGQVKDTVESYILLPPEDTFKEAKSLLEEQYGNQFVIANAFRDKLENWQHINPIDGTALQRYANFLRQHNTAMKSIGSLQVLNDEHKNQKMLRKLPDWVITRWTGFVS